MRAEAVAHETEWQCRRDAARMRDGGADVLRFIATTGPGPVAGADAAEVEPQRVPAALAARAGDARDERIAHLPAVRGQRMRDDDDRAGLAVGHAERALEAAVDALRFLTHGVQSRRNPRATPLYRLWKCAYGPLASRCSLSRPSLARLRG